MPKNNVFRVRLSDDELHDLQRAAAALKRPVAEYARLLLTTKSPQPQQTRIDESALSDIRAEIAELRESQSAAARAFDALLAQLRELMRVPSFREFRARCYIDGILEKPGEPAFDYLLRIAQMYYAQYHAWPDARDARTFGPTPQDFPREKWPAAPR